MMGAGRWWMIQLIKMTLLAKGQRMCFCVLCFVSRGFWILDCACFWLSLIWDLGFWCGFGLVLWVKWCTKSFESFQSFHLNWFLIRDSWFLIRVEWIKGEMETFVYEIWNVLNWIEIPCHMDSIFSVHSAHSAFIEIIKIKE